MADISNRPLNSGRLTWSFRLNRKSHLTTSTHVVHNRIRWRRRRRFRSGCILSRIDFIYHLHHPIASSGRWNHIILRRARHQLTHSGLVKTCESFAQLIVIV